jgi:threonine dehydrogenase-like Zn-dependent dehydrogenase
MRALVWEAPERMVYREADPPRPGPGEVLVAVSGVGVCGSELGAYLGHNELRVPPLVMGHEFAGEVVEVGRGGDPSLVGALVTVNPLVTCGRCRWCRSGQRQLCRDRKIIGIDFPGAFQDVVAVPEGSLWRLRNRSLGALVEPLACAVRAVAQAQVEPGDVVLVYGAGIIGLLAAWMARLRGARAVALSDANATRLDQGRAFSADRLFNPTRENVAAAVRDRWPDGVDRVIDAVGVAATRAEGADLVRRGGRLVLVGLHEPTSRVAANRIVRDEVEVVGSFCYRDQDFTVARDLVDADALPKAVGWIDRRPLGDGDAAFREQAMGPAPFAKIVLEPSREGSGDGR